MGTVLVAVSLIMVAAMLVFLSTIKWAPKVAEVASLIMAFCLGAIFVWLAGMAVAAGYIDGDAHSKLFRGRITRERDPIAYWWWVAFFAVPGLLLTFGSMLASLRMVRDALGRKSESTAKSQELS